jgi:hypothetical protein
MKDIAKDNPWRAAAFTVLAALTIVTVDSLRRQFILRRRLAWIEQEHEQVWQWALEQLEEKEASGESSSSGPS